MFFVVLPILRTKLTKQVEENEYAIMFIAAGVIETVGYDAVGAVSNSIYQHSLHFFPGLIFLILACIGIVPIGLMWYDIRSSFFFLIYSNSLFFFFLVI